MSVNCYCCSQIPFSECCEPVIHSLAAASPLALMRSRYSAFCLQNSDYLIATTLPAARSSELTTGLQETFATTQWRGLIIISHTAQEVEFCAFYSPKQDTSDLAQIHELSHFECIEGRWFYASGKHLPAIKIQRNDACFCGSQKKHKHCCAN